MSDKLSIETEIVERKVIITLKGQIDEDADFSKVSSLDLKEYIFDFAQISMINSCGIREWISFIEKIDEKAKILYRKCPQIIIEQINMVHGFIKPGAEIESFYAPYFNENTDSEIKVLLNTKDIVGKKAPEVKDPDSGDELEFDAIEEQYFSFIKG